MTQQEYFQQQKAKLLSCYHIEKSIDVVKVVEAKVEVIEKSEVIEDITNESVTEIKEQSFVEKAFDVINKSLEVFEKGGEGSRGGKVIGHTKSGKPIYDNSSATGQHKDFTKEDHADAVKVHKDKMEEHKKEGHKVNYHMAHRDAHKEMANKMTKDDDDKSKSKSSSFDKEVKAVMDASFNLRAEKHLQTAKTLRQQAKKLKSDLASGKYGQGATANIELKRLENRAKVHEAVYKQKSGK